MASEEGIILKIKKTLFFIGYLLVLPFFYGCAFYGPIYKKPTIKLMDKWTSSNQLTSIDHANLPAMAWWRSFNDTQLTQLIEQAIKNNNNIQMAMGNVIATQGELLQIQFSLMPSVNALLVGYTSSSANLLVPGYNSGFLPTYALNLFQFIRSNEWAKANLAVAEAGKDAVILTVIGQTAAAYFTYLGQSCLLNKQKQLVSDLNQLLLLSTKQYEHGLISLYSLQQYKQQYEKANAELPIVTNNVVLSKNALNLLLNKNPGHIPIEFEFMKLKSNGIIPTNLPSDVLKNRPDVREAEQKLIAANANVGITTSTFFPTITLTGIAGSGTSALSHLFSGSTDYWHYLTLSTMPLLAPEFMGQYKSAMGLRYAAYSNYIQTVRAAFKSVDNDLSSHQHYYASLVAQQTNFDSSNKAYHLAKISYKKGLYSYPTLLINKINLDQAHIDLIKIKLAQLNTIVQLYQDLGGGYAYKYGSKS